MSNKSASGTISGMTMTASPLLEDIRKFINVWNMNIAHTVTIVDMPPM